MSVSLELRKIRRTGLLPGMLAGGLLAGAFPILNIAVRPDTFLAMQGSPLSILFSQNWSMLGMLNLFFLIIGACILYHMEYADGAMEKMKALPLSQGGMFAAKTLLLWAMSCVVLILELLAMGFCAWHWFSATDIILPLLKEFGYQFMMLLPACIFMMLISSLCRNLWIALGIGVILLFTVIATITMDYFAVKLLPFSLPLSSFIEAGADGWQYLVAAGGESILLAFAEGILIPARRRFA